MGRSIQTKEAGPGAQYQAWTRVAEEPEAPWDENEVQRLWFEQAYRSPLRTLEGEQIEILQPGFWNRAGGPDFAHAALRTADGRVECGAVEIHLTPQDWSRHRHDRDRHYDPVILHVVWQAGPRMFYPSNSGGNAVRQVELSGQLRLPLAAARHAFRTTAAERAAGARIGRCHAELVRLDADRRMDLLEEAGWHRFLGRVERMRARVDLVGREQALWLGLADALGYSANRDAFAWVAHRMPVSRVLKWCNGLEREAWLYGSAGLLPDRLGRASARAWPRRVWDVWWPHRGAEGAPELPARRWVRRGLRPVNRPERRMAVLALVGNQDVWARFRDSVESGDGDAVAEQLSGLVHPFWSQRLSWEGAACAKPLALMGDGRIRSFLFNTVWPMAWGDRPGSVREQLAAARAVVENRPERVASVRLLGGGRTVGRGRSLLVQEGLLQIYQDFCLTDHRQCMTCEFPEMVRRWGGPGSSG